MKSLLVSVEDVTKVDDLTVHVKTKGPNPALVNNLTNLFIMDKEWSEQNNATQVQDLKAKTRTSPPANAMGTGPFQLVSREPDHATVMRRYENYWGKDQIQNDISEIVYRPIPEAATRVAALLSGEVDWVQDLPPQDIERLRTAQGVRVSTGPENRPIFLGMNVGVPELRPPT
jgi:peptide/nickel transport system substrate-binding protein